MIPNNERETRSRVSAEVFRTFWHCRIYSENNSKTFFKLNGG